MQDLAQYLIYIPVPQNISNQFEEWNKFIGSKHANTYKTYIDDKWSSHLMLYLSPMPGKNLTKILDEIKTFSSTLSTTKISFDRFTSKPDGFIFAEISEDSKTLLEEMHSNLVNILLRYRDQNIKPKYLERWDTYSEKQRNNIKTTGIPYEYEPHITVAKVDPNAALHAYQELVEKFKCDFTIDANQINILKFENGINTILGEFKIGE